MKRIKIMLAAVALIGVVSACTTTQQTLAYNTIGTVELTATAAVDGYYKAVIKGIASTNEVPDISQKYNQLQLACTLAAAAAQAGTNALASAEMTAELGNLTSLITALTTK